MPRKPRPTTPDRNRNQLALPFVPPREPPRELRTWRNQKITPWRTLPGFGEMLWSFAELADAVGRYFDDPDWIRAAVATKNALTWLRSIYDVGHEGRAVPAGIAGGCRVHGTSRCDRAGEAPWMDARDDVRGSDEPRS
jgi:hypothetical protein